MVRGVDRARSTTRLPTALREELGIEDSTQKGRPAKKARLFKVSARKEARKEQRQAKHASRAPKRRPAPVAPSKGPPTKSETEEHAKKAVSKVSPPKVAPTRLVMDPITGQMRPASSSSSSSKPTKLERMMRADDITSKERSKWHSISELERQEEDEIAWLEHQLYGKKGPSHKEGDDVDDLLDDLNRFYPGMYEASEGEADEDDLEGSEASEDQSSDDDLREWEEHGLDDDSQEESLDVQEDAKSDVKEVPVSQEDTTKDMPLSKYVPPALRGKASDATSLEQQKLRRHINGQLNRLAEGNLDTIVSELDGLYQTYSRGDVTAYITEQCLDTITAQMNLSESIIVLYAALLTAMHRIVGAEFAAHVLQVSISRFMSTYGRLLQADSHASTRECVNIVTLLCHLFNVKMFSDVILYDMVRLFLGQSFVHMVPGVAGEKPITEMDIELLLRVVQSSGQQLRHADAESLSAIVELTQQCMQGAPVVAESSRARFMLEALIHLKQKGKHLGRDVSATAESVQRLSKYISSLERKRTLRAHSALQVGLQDLQDATRHGRWWLVGAAWTGKEREPASVPVSEPEATDSPGHDLSHLARAQGMNTEARRMVFSALMSSLDYQDAAHHVMQLKLNDVQRREVIRVLLHCLANERTFNPYYVLVGQQLADDHVGMRVTMQYVLWDYFRELGEKHVGGHKVVREDEEGEEYDVHVGERLRKLLHLARAYGYWIARGALTLLVLKTVDFTALHEAGTLFLQHLLLHTFLMSQTRLPMLTPRARQNLLRAPSQVDRERIEQLLVRGTVGQPRLAQGLFVFCHMHLQRETLATLLGDVAIVRRLEWTVNVARDTLSVGAASADASDA